MDNQSSLPFPLNSKGTAFYLFPKVFDPRATQLSFVIL